MTLVLEGLVTTLNQDGSTNIAPMGPLVDRELTHITLKPFQSSQTFSNLQRHAEGVFHVTDNVDMLARAAVNQLPLPGLFPAHVVRGHVIADACRWFELRVQQLDIQQQRAVLSCEVVHQGHLRDFFGFNRAKHAVVEAAILATRIGILSHAQILSEFARLKVLIDKTGDDQEEDAFRFLESYVRGKI